MKPEQSEQFLIEELFNKTKDKGFLKTETLVEIDKLTGDASTRRYYRIYTNLSSYVVCLDNPFDHGVESHPFLSVQKFLFDHQISVPRIIDHNLPKGYSLQQDLGDVTLIQHLAGLKTIHDEKEIYKKIIDQLLVLHRVTREEVHNPELFKLSFDYQKFMDETRFTFKYFIEIFLKIKDQDLISKLEAQFSPIMERLSKQKMVITHRDFHSRNIMLKDGTTFFIDFQDARWGIPQYDLTSLLEDCYYDVDETNRTHLKRYYFDNLSPEIHGQESFEKFLELYNDMTIQRVFKAVGSFCYIYNWRKDDRYLKYIGFGMEKIRRVLMSDPRYSELKQTLFSLYYAT